MEKNFRNWNPKVVSIPFEEPLNVKETKFYPFAVFANYFRNQAPRVFHGDHCLHYLKWLSLLALTLTLSESHECSEQTMNLLPNFLIDASGNSDIWYIK